MRVEVVDRIQPTLVPGEHPFMTGAFTPKKSCEMTITALRTSPSISAVTGRSPPNGLLAFLPMTMLLTFGAVETAKALPYTLSMSLHGETLPKGVLR